MDADCYIQAITYASDRGIDVVSMSFGSSQKSDVIVRAIRSSREMLLFAAANNEGLNEAEMFPASSEAVISVRGTDHDGLFLQPYNPSPRQHKAAPHFGTLASAVPCVYPEPNRLIKSGCSVATPIMAAMAATIIRYVDRESVLHRYHDHVRTSQGMLAIFRAMTEEQKSERRYLAPWLLYQNGRDTTHLIGNALSGSL
jgi:hypothetical protein